MLHVLMPAQAYIDHLYFANPVKCVDCTVSSTCKVSGDACGLSLTTLLCYYTLFTTLTYRPSTYHPSRITLDLPPFIISHPVQGFWSAQQAASAKHLLALIILHSPFFHVPSFHFPPSTLSQPVTGILRAGGLRDSGHVAEEEQCRE